MKSNVLHWLAGVIFGIHAIVYIIAVYIAISSKLLGFNLNSINAIGITCAFVLLTVSMFTKNYRYGIGGTAITLILAIIAIFPVFEWIKYVGFKYLLLIVFAVAPTIFLFLTTCFKKHAALFGILAGSLNVWNYFYTIILGSTSFAFWNFLIVLIQGTAYILMGLGIHEESNRQ